MGGLLAAPRLRAADNSQAHTYLCCCAGEGPGSTTASDTPGSGRQRAGMPSTPLLPEQSPAPLGSPTAAPGTASSAGAHLQQLPAWEQTLLGGSSQASPPSRAPLPHTGASQTWRTQRWPRFSATLHPRQPPKALGQVAREGQAWLQSPGTGWRGPVFPAASA